MKLSFNIPTIYMVREKAVAMAGLLGQTVGKPWEVTEESDLYAQDVTPNLNMRYKSNQLLPEAR